MNYFTVTVTDAELQVLQWLVQTQNAENNTSITVADYLQQRTPELIQPYVLRFATWEADEVKKRFVAADDATKTSVKTALGL